MQKIAHFIAIFCKTLQKDFGFCRNKLRKFAGGHCAPSRYLIRSARRGAAAARRARQGHPAGHPEGHPASQAIGRVVYRKDTQQPCFCGEAAAFDEGSMPAPKRVPRFDLTVWTPERTPSYFGRVVQPPLLSMARCHRQNETTLFRHSLCVCVFVSVGGHSGSAVSRPLAL